MPEVIPSDREIEILKVLWKRGEATVRQVLDELAPRGELAFNTVQTQLRIMESKKLVRHRASGRSFIYRPLYTREEAGARFLHKVFDGAMSQLVLTLLNTETVSDAELAELENTIADARQATGPSTRRKRL